MWVSKAEWKRLMKRMDILENQVSTLNVDSKVYTGTYHTVPLQTAVLLLLDHLKLQVVHEQRKSSVVLKPLKTYPNFPIVPEPRVED